MAKKATKIIIHPPAHHIHFGDTNTGKTTQAKKFIMNYLKRGKQGKGPKKVLILSSTAYEYSPQATKIKSKMDLKFTSGVRFVNCTTAKNLLIEDSISLFRDGVIIIEKPTSLLAYPSFRRTFDWVLMHAKITNVSTYCTDYYAARLPEKYTGMLTSVTIGKRGGPSTMVDFPIQSKILRIADHCRDMALMQIYRKNARKYKSDYRRIMNNNKSDRYLTMMVDLSREKILCKEDIFVMGLQDYCEQTLPENTIKNLLGRYELMKSGVQYHSKSPK